MLVGLIRVVSSWVTLRRLTTLLLEMGRLLGRSLRLCRLIVVSGLVFRRVSLTLLCRRRRMRVPLLVLTFRLLCWLGLRLWWLRCGRCSWVVRRLVSLGLSCRLVLRLRLRMRVRRVRLRMGLRLLRKRLLFDGGVVCVVFGTWYGGLGAEKMLAGA